MKQSPQWMKSQPYLEYVMIRMDETYRVQLKPEQSMELFLKSKPKTRSWCDHLTYRISILYSTRCCRHGYCIEFYCWTC